VTRRDLDARVVLITGAGRGIGQAIAIATAAAGADVAVLDIDPERAAATAAEIEALGRRAIVLSADVTDPVARAAALGALTRSPLGFPDILVNNAGIQIVDDALRMEARDVRRLLSVNFEAPFALTQEVAREWVAGDVAGAVVNIVSIAGAVHFPGHAAYSASKAALRAATGALAFELAPFGIRVNAVAPGHVETAMSLPQTPEKAAERLRWIPLGRLAQVDDIAPVVVFLASSRARYITGQTLTVDGGYTLQ
jgi:NAD(P)-dependent dehydrogenase (short-subunit alcohol dehydrogenase family)